MDPQLDHTPSPHLPTNKQKTPLEQLEVYKKISIILTVVIVVLLLLVVVFGAKAFMNNSELDAAQKKGQQEGASAQKAADQKQFNQERNSELKTYTAPQESGSFQVTFPKFWSLAVTPGDAGALSAIAMPDSVDTKLDQYAMRFSLLNKQVSDVQKQFASLLAEKDPKKRKLSQEEVTVSGIKGTRYTGQISSKIPNGTIVVVPLRDKTFTIQTDDNSVYLETFNAIVNNLKLNP